MPAFERKQIHHTLSKDEQIKTHSEGDEPYRYLVVEPVKKYFKANKTKKRWQHLSKGMTEIVANVSLLNDFLAVSVSFFYVMIISNYSSSKFQMKKFL